MNQEKVNTESKLQTTKIDEYGEKKESRNRHYTEFRESEIEGVDKIPKNWDIKKLKQISDVFPSNVDKKEKDSEPPIKLCNYTEVYNNSEIDRTLDFMEATAKKKEIKKHRLEEGDVIITKDSESWNDICVPTYVAETMKDVICGYHLAQIKPNDSLIHGKFLYYVLKSEPLAYYFSTRAKGVTRFGISKNAIKEARIIQPSKNEQEAIVDFLNNETKKIDELIDKKEKLIDLLEEKRTAIITKRVTKGLDLEVEMKDSGIEWLGEIPKHWDVSKLRYLGNIETGDKDTKDREENGDYPFFVRSQEVERINSYSFDGEAVLTAGDGVGVGEVFHYINGKFDYHQRVYKISHFDEDIYGKYLYYYLKAHLKKEIFKHNAKSTVDSLRMPMFKNFSVAFGDIGEQKEIVSHLEDETQKIDALIDKIKEAIEKLKEYRTALITNAVTGKIDVRGEV